ncbi:MAG: hypothetical protein LBL55_01045 [Propionibacteriaceae bacterium]|jgi:hypothetical protein|nr:hypothetical protein [Propionibacteriaceae bacterium]
MARRPRILLIAVVLALGLAAVGCAVADLYQDRTGPTRESAPKNGSGERRSEEPLTRRFPLLDGATAAVWYSGTTDSRLAPGPSTYWIDAVITVDDETAATIEADPTLTAAAERPNVVAALRSDLPPDLVTSAALADALLAGGYQHPLFAITAFYSPVTRQVVICAIGQ